MSHLFEIASIELKMIIAARSILKKVLKLMHKSESKNKIIFDKIDEVQRELKIIINNHYKEMNN